MSIMGRGPVARRRGYTLIEILVVIAMIGVMAALAIVGVRTWMRWARTGKDKDLLQTIAYGEHAYFQDTGGYLDCSAAWTDYYPAPPDNRKRLFHNQGHPDYACWHLLAPDAESGTYVGFAVRAGTNVEAAP